MEQFGQMASGAGVLFYVVIILFLAIAGWWGFKTFRRQRSKHRADLPRAEKEKSYEEVSDEVKQTNTDSEIKIGRGNYKCLCFRVIKGVAVADFTSITRPLGELYAFDPSCPYSGNGYIVKENEQGTIVDYDPRQVEYKKENSPEYAWFAIVWDICDRVWFAPTNWLKSAATWMAVAMLVIVFVTSLAVIGG